MKGSKTKSQIALEFIIYVGVSLVMFAGITYGATSQIQSIQETNKLNAVQDLSASLRYQLTYLASMPPGTQMVVVLPDRIANRYIYNLTTFSTYSNIRLDEIDYIVATPVVAGSFVIGRNTVLVESDKLVIENE